MNSEAFIGSVIWGRSVLVSGPWGLPGEYGTSRSNPGRLPDVTPLTREVFWHPSINSLRNLTVTGSVRILRRKGGERGKGQGIQHVVNSAKQVQAGAQVFALATVG